MTKINPAVLGTFMDETIYVIPSEDGSTSKSAKVAPENTGVNQLEAVTPPQPSEIDVHEVMIVAYDSDKDFLEEESMALLTNILKAVGTDIKATHKVNLANTPSPKEYFQKNRANKVLLFCNEAQEHFSEVTSNYVLTKVGESTVLLSDSLKELNADVEKKKKLWICLKSLFLKE